MIQRFTRLAPDFIAEVLERHRIKRLCQPLMHASPYRLRNALGVSMGIL
jgi:hypothetical protein